MGSADVLDVGCLLRQVLLSLCGVLLCCLKFLVLVINPSLGIWRGIVQVRQCSATQQNPQLFYPPYFFPPLAWYKLKFLEVVGGWRESRVCVST